MSVRKNLVRGRSHIIMALALIVAGTVIVQIEDEALQKEVGKAPPDHFKALHGKTAAKP
ncbi:MAG: hypothetical protein KDE32_02715 [Novosphingobium sp.]|nr:hypothetical protein [Novosphingobium sp.]